MAGWSFFQDLDGRWQWRHEDGGRTRLSARSFHSRVACIADARVHGYRTRSDGTGGSDPDDGAPPSR